ncbi:MAG: NUDIX domain-containing protein [Clostridia bacterium]|nr:NUDIX domain-containing protein [Clostridia bacterium]
MDKFREIRPIVLGVAVRNKKLLVSESIDSVKNQLFCRCLGGGIEFCETSEMALKREYMEELGIPINIKNLIKVVENIFEYEGKRAHEIVFLYKIDIDDKDYKEEYKAVEDGKDFVAKWVDINEFIEERKIIYPTEIITYLQKIN